MTDPEKTKKPPGGLIAWVIWGAASLFYLYEYFLRVAPSVMVHPIMVHFQITAASMGALAAFYYFAYSPMQIAVGLLLDRFGGGKVLPIAAGVAALGSFLFGSTQAYWMAGMGRILMGMGSAFAFVGAMYVATNWFPPKNFALLSGLCTMLGMVGAFIGQGPTAMVVARTGWQGTWVGAAIAGVLLGVILYFFIPKRPKWAQRRAEKHGRKDAFPVLANLARVLKNPQSWIIGLFGGLLYVPTSTFGALWGVPFLEYTYDIPKVTAATAISMIFLGWVVGSPLAGWISDRIEKRKPLMIFSSIGVLVLCLVLIYIPGWPVPLLFALLLAIGILSGGQVVCFASAYEVNPHNAKGSALAVNNMLVMITGAILQPVVGWMLDLRYPHTKVIGAAHFSRGDYEFALGVVPASVLLALIFSLMIRETHGKPPEG